MRSATKLILLSTAAIAALGIWWLRTEDLPPAVTAPKSEPAKQSPSVKSAPLEDRHAKPAAMDNPITYAATRLLEIKAEPEKWKSPWAWREEYGSADTPELKREVVGLARQVSGESLVAMLPLAFKSEDELTRLDASRSLPMLPEKQMRDGFSAGFTSGDAETRQDVMDQIQQVQPVLRPELLKAALGSGVPDVQRRAIEMLSEAPSPAYFSVLIEGLRMTSPEVLPEVRTAIHAMVEKDFTSFDEASRWWGENREKYDDLMTRAE